MVLGNIQISRRVLKEVKTVLVGTTYINSPIQEIEVFYDYDTDGAGSNYYFRTDFVKTIKDIFEPSQEDYDYFMKHSKLPDKKIRCLEMCSGSGFIGFDLLSNDVCQELILSDINPHAIELCEMTISHNSILKDFVKTYVSDCFNSIPTSEKFDLIILNPPHFYTDNEEEMQNNPCYYDYKWQFHKKFFAQVKEYLKPNGIVILLENIEGSKPYTFFDMVKGKLILYKISRASWLTRGIIRTLIGKNPYYYMYFKPDDTKINPHRMNLLSLDMW